jgi:outer membrane receptor protein involved in Fe transport
MLGLLLSAGPVLHAGGRAHAGDRAYAGRPIVEALNEIRAGGLNLIWSSDLVRPDMIIATEPPVVAPRQLLDRLLASFGLVARDGPAGTIVVVRAPGSEQSSTPGSGAADAGRERRPAVETPSVREWMKVTPSAGDEPASMTRVQGSDIGPAPSMGNDASRAIVSVPGLSAADKSAQLRIRGGATDEALVLLDGLEIDEPFHLTDFLAFSSIVDAQAIGRADIMTGVFPTEYGNRAGGVIDFSTLEPSAVTHTTVGASLLNASLLSGGGLGNDLGTWLVSARSWHPDQVLHSVDPGGEEIDPSYSDLLGKLQLRLKGGSSLTAHVLASRDAVDHRSDPGDSIARADEDHQYFWIDWKSVWSPKLYAETVVSNALVTRSRRGSVIEGTNGVTQVDDARSDSSIGLKQDWTFIPGGRLSWKWGFGARRLAAEYDYRSHVVPPEGTPSTGVASPSVVDRDLALDPAGTELGAYVAGQWRIVQPLTVELGVRRDQQTLTHETGTSPRVNVAWTIGASDILRIGWGRFIQPQGINELQIEDGVTDFAPAERSDQWELDYDHHFADGLTLGVAAYEKDMDHPRPRYENLFNPFELFPESGPDRVRIAADRALSRGIEIALGMDRGGPLAWRASYTLASVEDRIDGTWVPRSWDQPHTFSFELHTRRGGKWELGLAGLYHTGWPTTAVSAVQVPNPDGSSSIQPILGPRNAERFPPYHRLDLRLTRRFDIGHGTLGVYLDVANVYGRRNVCCIDDFQYLPQADGSVRVDEKQGYGLRQLPNVGLIWDF